MALDDLRMTKTTIAVLELLLAAAPRDPQWGRRICDEADLDFGTVYGILHRLEERGWVTAADEDPGLHPGRRARRFYRLTKPGRAGAISALHARQVRMGR